MTSVLNHLQPLNGNKFFVFVLLLSVFTACNPKKNLPRKPSTTVPADRDEEVVKKQAKADTVDWVFEEDENFPPITDEDLVEDRKEGLELKDQYRVAVFLPVQSTTYTGIESSDESYVQYYAGMKLAVQELENQGSRIDIDVFESSQFKQVGDLNRYDVVVAANNKEQILDIISMTEEQGSTLVISPWYSNSKATRNNPNYLQLRPNLKEHFNKITEHALKQFAPDEIVLVGSNNSLDKSWFAYFQEVGKAYLNADKNPFTEHFITNDSLALGTWVFGSLLEEGKKAFIVPNYSFRDENRVYSTLRRLSAEKGEHKICVYGMPLLLESDKIDYDYYANLNIRIAISEFVNPSSSESKYFSSRFYSTYGALPTKDAYEGHDLLIYLAESLQSFGIGFPRYQNEKSRNYLQTSYKIRPVNVDSESYENSAHIDFYENKYLSIIEFVNGSFRKSD